MLYSERIDVSEGIEVNKTSKSKEWYLWHFLDKWFKFKLHVCNGCHDVLLMSINLITIKVLFSEDLSTDNIIVSNKIFSYGINMI